jgi:hypothetical protein
MAVIPDRINQAVRGGTSEKMFGIQFGLWVRGLPQEAEELLPPNCFFCALQEQSKKNPATSANGAEIKTPE